MIAVIGDPHFQSPADYNYVTKKGSVKNRILEASAKALSHIFSECAEQGISDIFITGDMTEAKDKLPNFIKNKILHVFDKAAEQKLKIYICAGNHDWSPDNHSSVRWLESYPNVFISYDYDVVEIEDKRVLMIPYHKDSTYIEWILEHHAKKNIDCVVGHFTPDRCVAGFKQMEGVNWTYMQSYPSTFLGHIHNHQELNRTIYIVGSTYQTDWSELDDTYYMTYDFEHRAKWNKIPKFVDRKIIPIFEKADLKSLDGIEKHHFVRIDISNKMAQYVPEITETVDCKYLAFKYFHLTEEAVTMDLQKVSASKVMEDFISSALQEIDKKDHKKYRKGLEQVVGV